MKERQALEASIGELTGRLTSLSVTEKAELDKLDAKLRMLEAKEAMLKAEAAMLDARKKLVDDPGDPRKIAWSEEAKRDLDRAREHYYEMCRLWGVLATPVQQAAATAVGSQVFKMEASIAGARRAYGVRSAVYRAAEENQAHYFPAKGEGICYKDAADRTLYISLLFKSESAAYAFETFLSQTYMKRQENQVCFTASHSVSAMGTSGLAAPLTRVMWEDYVASDTDSPSQSRDDAALSASLSAVETSNENFKYLGVEHPSTFWAHHKAIKAHIRPKATFSGRNGVDDEYNNRVLISPHLHNYLDGTVVEPTMTPQVNMVFAGECPGEFQVDSEMQRRYKVLVNWVFFDDFPPIVWKEAVKVDAESKTATVVLWVRDVALFKENVEYRTKLNNEDYGLNNE